MESNARILCKNKKNMMNTNSSSHITLHRVNELTSEQQSARQALSMSVYPPNEEWAGRSIGMVAWRVVSLSVGIRTIAHYPLLAQLFAAVH